MTARPTGSSAAAGVVGIAAALSIGAMVVVALLTGAGSAGAGSIGAGPLRAGALGVELAGSVGVWSVGVWPVAATAVADGMIGEGPVGEGPIGGAPSGGAPSGDEGVGEGAEEGGTAEEALQVGFLIVDGVYNSELMAPYDIFQHTIFHTQPGMETFTVSPDGESVTSFEGLEIGAHHSFGTAPEIDVLVVPSAENSMDSDLENEAMMAWVAKVGAEARYVVSLCDGAFVLAAAGLLDGRASTTFPGDLERYEEMFPGLDVRRGVSFVHDGPMITSQGGAKSYDPAMYLVALLYGDAVAQRVGRGLIIDWPPAEGAMPHLVVDPP